MNSVKMCDNKDQYQKYLDRLFTQKDKRESVYIAVGRQNGKSLLALEAKNFPADLMQKQDKQITNVILNPPATIVFWGDGTKTVVKCQEDDVFDPEKGLAMAIAKKFFDNKGSYCNQIKPWIEKYEEESAVDALERLKKFEQALGGSLVKIGNEEELKNIENDEKVQTALKSLSSIKFKTPDLSPFRKALHELQERKKDKTNLVRIEDEQGLLNVATGEKIVLSSKRTPLEEAYWKLVTLGEQHSKEDLQAAIDEAIGYLGQALVGKR